MKGKIRMMRFIDSSKACCFTGHRRIAQAKCNAVHTAVAEIIEQFYQSGFRTFICGGAVGFDTIAALEVISARVKHSDMRLILILPCDDQTTGWRPNERAVYRRIRKAADEVIVLHEEFTDGCMLERNRIMIENSSACIAYHDGRNSGGTYYTYKESQKAGHQCINLYGEVNKSECKNASAPDEV